MAKLGDYTVWHDLDLHDITVHIAINWEYYGGHMQTYHDPEESASVLFVSVDVPDQLEPRKEEIEWVVQDQIGELEDEALENIHNQFERMQTGGEYA